MNGKSNYETNTGNFSFFISLNFNFQGFRKGTIVFFTSTCFFHCQIIKYTMERICKFFKAEFKNQPSKCYVKL